VAAVSKDAKLPKLPRHGTRYRYVGFGCRCNKCRAANASYQLARTEKMTALANKG
jgi:hypothetical protein